jgi:hypothetical protein
MSGVNAMAKYVGSATEFTDAESHLQRMQEIGSPEDIITAGERLGRAHAAMLKAWEAVPEDSRGALQPPEHFAPFTRQAPDRRSNQSANST